MFCQNQTRLRIFEEEKKPYTRSPMPHRTLHWSTIIVHLYWCLALHGQSYLPSMSMLEMHYRLPAWIAQTLPEQWLAFHAENLYSVAYLNRFGVVVGTRIGDKTQWMTRANLLHWKQYIKARTGIAVVRQMGRALWMGLEPTLRLQNLSYRWQIHTAGIRLHHTAQITKSVWQLGLIGYEAPTRRGEFDKPLLYIAHGIVGKLIPPMYGMLWGRYSPEHHELTAHILLQWKTSYVEVFLGIVHWTWGLAFQQPLTARSLLLLRYHMHPILGASWSMNAIFRWPST